MTDTFTINPRYISLVRRQAAELGLEPEAYAEERLKASVDGLRIMNPARADDLVNILKDFEGSKVEAMAILLANMSISFSDDVLKDFPMLKKEPVS